MIATYDYEMEAPRTEQEIPPEIVCSSSEISTLSPKDAADLERSVQVKKAEQEIHLKDSAFSLLCACLAGGFFLYCMDTLVVAGGTKSSEMLTNLFDLIKTVITFLLGYLFAYEKPKK